MTAQHTPGPWKVVGNQGYKATTVYMTVERRSADGRREYLLTPGGNIRRFKTEEAAIAAIAKATGSPS